MHRDPLPLWCRLEPPASRSVRLTLGLLALFCSAVVACSPTGPHAGDGADHDSGHGPAHAAEPHHTDASRLHGTVIDLTHAFDEDAVYWPTAEGFKLETVFRGRTEGGWYYAANNFFAAEHGGTHLDAPIHFHEGGQTADEIPLERLIGPGARIDVHAACAEDRDYLVTVADFEAWEERNGRLPQGAIVLVDTGFARFWPDRVRYMGTDERGEGAVPKLHFPGLDPDAARWLAEERSIGAIGLDTPSIDHGPSTTFDAHVALSSANIPALENVASMDGLPEAGFTVVALPMKIKGGSGGPARIVAIVP